MIKEFFKKIFKIHSPSEEIMPKLDGWIDVEDYKKGWEMK